MAKKIILIVLGLLALIVGLAITAVGSVGLGFGGRSGVIQSGYHTISTPTNAFVSDPSRIRNSNNVGRTGSSVTLRVDGRDPSRPLFLGIGPSSQVTAYLNGSSYDEINDVHFNGFRMDTTRVNGSAQPAAPADQSFWVAQATGTDPQLRWPVTDGDYRLVIMNADSSPGVSLDVRGGLKIKDLFGISLGATIFGALLALLGLGLMIWGITAKRRGEEAATGYPPGGYPATAAGGGYPPQPGGYTPGGYPPQPGGYPPGSYPPGSYPPGSYPAGGYPPGSYPPGSYPPESQPPEGQPPDQPTESYPPSAGGPPPPPPPDSGTAPPDETQPPGGGTSRS